VIITGYDTTTGELLYRHENDEAEHRHYAYLISSDPRIVLHSLISDRIKAEELISINGGGLPAILKRIDL
jgi:hypothetical protein